MPNQGGEGAEFELVETLETLNPQTDLDFFTQDGVTYASVGTLAGGLNDAGQTIVKLSDENGEVSRDTIGFVSGHASATCPTNPRSALGLQHDVEATPKGRAISNSTSSRPVKRDTQLILDATDAPGRCHDQGVLGVLAAPRGGLEIVDVSDLNNPVEIGLTSHIGEAHTVNIDPKRPHIAYAVTSDAVGIAKDTNDIDGDGNTEELIRLNEDPNGTGGNALDGFEVVDLSTCMNVNDRASFGRKASDEQKRGVDPATGEILEGKGCRPQVYRFRYPNLRIGLGHTRQTGNQGLFGCHETEIYQNDLLTCGGGNAAILFDMSRAFNDMGTPRDFTDDKPRGKPLPCRVRKSTTVVPAYRTGALVTDCVVGENDVDLRIPNWKKIGSPSLKGVKHVGSAHHQGRGAQPEENEEQEESTGVTTAFNAKQDIDFNHETELTHSGDFLIATDERGGGVVPPGASCSPGIDNPDGNGGLHAYAVDRLDTRLPGSAKEAFDAYALTPEGDKAIIRAEVNTQTQPSFCTAHVMQQVPGQNRIFMGWYTQGTRVFDYKENKDGTFEFAEVAHFIPTNANEWVSHVFKVDRNSDGSFTYYGVAADFFFGNAGRNAIDVYKATLPPVGEVFARDGKTDGPGGDGPGGDGPGGDGPGGDGPGGDGPGGGGVGNAPTLPATGGPMGMIPLGVALLGGAAWVGRSRRKGSEVN